MQQQGLLSGFSRRALDADNLEPLLNEASAIAAAGLRVGRASILEQSLEDALFKVTSSVGWGAAAPPGLRVNADPDSVAGHAFRTGMPSVWAEAEALGRDSARSARLWHEHGIRSAICVPIGADQAKAFGVLEVCSLKDRTFDEHDLAYLQSLADLLAAAISRQRQRHAWAGQLTTAASKLQAAEEKLLAESILVREAHHRIANSLQLLCSLLHVQAKHVADLETQDQIEGAMRRVAAFGVLHRRMCETGDGLEADAKGYLTGMLDEMRGILPDGSDRVLCLQIDSFMLPTDDLTAVGLIAGELVTNAVKYGHGTVTVEVGGGRRGSIFASRMMAVGFHPISMWRHPLA